MVLIDRFIDTMGATQPKEVERITGVPAATFRRWKRLRKADKRVTEVRGEPKAALLRAINGQSTEPLNGDTPAPPGAERDDHTGETWPDYLTEVLVRKARAAEKRADAALIWARWLEKEADGWAGAMPQPALTSSEEAAAREEEAKREEERRRNQAQPSAG